MRALIKHTESNRTVFRLEETAQPEIQAETDVKMKIEAIGVCASDIHALHGAMNIPEGNIVGHEYSATVVQVGSAVDNVSIGDRVVGELAIGRCGKCAMCLSGRYEFCEFKRPQGWHSPGVYAEYSVSPADLLRKIPKEVSFNEAALTEPMAVCVYGCIERGGIKSGDSVVIYGMGSIGLLTLIALQDLGVKNIICVTPTTHGRKRFETAMAIGAQHVCTPAEDLSSFLKELTGVGQADCVVDCSGSPQAINAGLEILRKDGTFVALGIASDEVIPIRFNIGVLSALRLVFSCTSSGSSWDTALQILSRRQIEVNRIITDVLSLEDWEKAYRKLEDREAIKAVLVP